MGGLITFPGIGAVPADLMIIAERPGKADAERGELIHPYTAMGAEIDRFLWTVLRLSRDQIFYTNLVQGYIERETTNVDLKHWEPHLLRDISRVRPKVIMTLGPEAMKYFLRSGDMDMHYALPQPWTDADGRQIAIIPNYLRLYDSDLQPRIWYGFEQCRRLLKDEIQCHQMDRGGAFDYREVAQGDTYPTGIVAVDTEGLHGNPWGLSYSVAPRTARVVKASWSEWLDALHLPLAKSLVVLHNSLHDLAVLRDMGITILRFEDTMVMAFLLGLEPQSLKELAYRHRGIKRESYMEVIGPASKVLALRWLSGVALQDWGPAPVEMVYVNGVVKEKHPWSVNRRIDGIMGVRIGEINVGLGQSKKAMTAAKKKLESIGVKVGKYTVNKDGWINCRVSSLAFTLLEPLWCKEFVWSLEEDDSAEDPRKRWEALCVDMPEATDRIELKCGEMPEAGLDALEKVFGEEGRQKAIRYSSGDADDTLVIFNILKPRIEEMGLQAAYALDMAVMPMIDRMMHTGFHADRKYFQKLGGELEVEMTKVRREIARLIGRDLNPNSSTQVAALLFDEWKLPVQQRTSTKLPSTADEVIEALRLESPNEVLPLISDYRELSKMKGTYADKLWRWLGNDNRIHTKLRITRVPSGRLASSEPNLMAIPVRSQRMLGEEKLGKRIRNGFTAGKEGRVLGSWDLDQIEMRVLAHRSMDPTLIEVFTTGQDIHAKTASLVFDLPITACSKGSWQRDAAKAIGFGIVYGVTAKGLQLQLKLLGINKNEEECQKFIDAYLVVAYPRIRVLMDQKKAEARLNGFVRSMLGRIRYLPGAMAAEGKKLRAESERMCLNHDIQTTAQEIMKLGMVGVWQRVLPLIQAEGYYCEPILQIHDELILEMDERIFNIVDVLVRNEMQEAMKLVIPIGVKGSCAVAWGGLK